MKPMKLDPNNYSTLRTKDSVSNRVVGWVDRESVNNLLVPLTHISAP